MFHPQAPPIRWLYEKGTRLGLKSNPDKSCSLQNKSITYTQSLDTYQTFLSTPVVLFAWSRLDMIFLEIKAHFKYTTCRNIYNIHNNISVSSVQYSGTHLVTVSKLGRINLVARFLVIPMNGWSSLEEGKSLYHPDKWRRIQNFPSMLFFPPLICKTCGYLFCWFIKHKTDSECLHLPFDGFDLLVFSFLLPVWAERERAW